MLYRLHPGLFLESGDAVQGGGYVPVDVLLQRCRLAMVIHCIHDPIKSRRAVRLNPILNHPQGNIGLKFKPLISFELLIPFISPSVLNDRPVSYTHLGPKYNNTGSEGHYEQDFVQFSKWGFDYVKVDWCGGAEEKRPGAVQYAQVARAIQHAEKTTGRRLFLSICEWGSQNPWFWAPGVGGIESTVWRTGGDIIPPVVESLEDPEHAKRFITLKNVLDSFEAGMHPEAQHTGYYNDLDMMVMGCLLYTSPPQFSRR